MKRQLLAKGQSAVVGKGKTSMPKPPAETVTTSTPVTASLPKTESCGSTSPSSVMAETPKTTSRVEERQHTAKRLTVRKEATLSQVEADLAISTGALETDAENYADVDIAGNENVYSDIEPDSPPRVASQDQQQESEATMGAVLVPEIIAEFRETIMVSDDGEPKLRENIPSAALTEKPPAVSAEPPARATSTATPAPSRVEKSESATSVDVSARIPTRPAKPYAPPAKKLETSLPEMQSVSKSSPELAQHAKRHIKTVSSLHLANAAVDFHTSTAQIVERFAVQYALSSEEKYEISREIKKIRLGGKMLALKVRTEFPLNTKTESDRSVFLDWLENETRLIASHNSDSEDSTVELGSSIDMQAHP